MISINVSHSQSLTSNIKYQLETGIHLSSSGKTPFWLRSNQYGIVPLEAQFATFRGSAHKEYDSTKNENQKLKKFGVGYGAWTVVNVGKVNQLLLPEVYIKARYGVFEFYGGRRREIVGLVDTTLTSGSYIWSGNAMPIPKLQISIPNYVSIIGKGLISIKGAYAHGWFGNQGVVRNYYLHQKYLYGRIGRPNWRIKMYGGLNHQVQWGGHITDIVTQSALKSFRDDGSLPNTLADYLKIVTGVSVGQLKLDNKIDTTRFSSFDLYNRSGNHLGSVDLAVELSFDNANIFFYRQSIYEDGSLYYLNNIKDGLLGVNITFKNNPIVKKITFERLYTQNQGNDIDPRPWIQGGDNYFSHGQYIEGWSYNRNIIGTPFISREETTSDKLPMNTVLNTNNSFKINNNLVNSIYFAVLCQLRGIDFLARVSHSSNLGVSSFNLSKPIKQNNIFLNISKSSPSLYYSLSLSLDSGSLNSKAFGCFFSCKKQLPNNK